MISEDIRSAISSQASVDGHLHCGGRCGATIDLFGQEAVPANLSVAQESKKEKPISAIFGPYGSASSASAALQSSLESRLRQQLPTGGLTMFIKGWKRKTTPLGRLYCQLAVLAHPTVEIDSGLWPTPKASAAGPDFAKLDRSATGLSLATAASLWPTTTKMDAHSSRRHGYMKKGNPGTTLTDAANMAMWQTPVADDSVARAKGKFNSRGEPKLSAQAILGTTRSGSNAPMESGGQLNPAFPCWLMGFPSEWESCADTATPSSRRLPRNSSKQRRKSEAACDTP